MALILNIETATRNCSVAISENGTCLAVVEESAEKYVHAEKLHPFIEKALEIAGKKISDLDAVAVSNGPGSYTGLRIGISAAKGICFALNIPMIALNTNDILVEAVSVEPETEMYLSVLDARRNEVYARIYDASKKPLSEITAVVLNENSYRELSEKMLCIVGDAAEKTSTILDFDNLWVVPNFPSAANMCALAEVDFAAKNFADVAYHEPFYLKDFIAGKPKKLLYINYFDFAESSKR